MKKFLLRILCFALFCALLSLAVPVVIDPYNVFHVNGLRDNGVEPNKNYIKMCYLLENPEKYDSLLFGSSRVGSIHTEKLADKNCYNMTYSAGIPQEHLDNLKTLLENGIVPKAIYLGVDSVSYTESAADHREEPLRSPYEYSVSHKIDFWKLYFQAPVAVASLDVTLNHEQELGFAQHFYSYGWWCDYDRETEIDWDEAEPIIGDYDCMPQCLEAIREIVRLCRDNQIELVVFTNPMHHITYEASLERDWLVFLRELAQITDYYNFSGLNSITLENANYIDSSHYKAQVGDLILARIDMGESDLALEAQGFGVYVTGENVEQLIQLLERQ